MCHHQSHNNHQCYNLLNDDYFTGILSTLHVFKHQPYEVVLWSSAFKVEETKACRD